MESWSWHRSNRMKCQIQIEIVQEVIWEIIVQEVILPEIVIEVILQEVIVQEVILEEIEQEVTMEVTMLIMKMGILIVEEQME